MQMKKITISRTVLYERVWATPIRTLAREFGLSDVGLAKVCRRHNIPRPGLGYWACVQAGHKMKQTPLPAMTDQHLDTIEIWPSEVSPIKKSDIKEQTPIPIIEINAEREIVHSIVQRIEKSLCNSKTDERGTLLTRLDRTVPIKASAGVLPRCLRILDALFSSLEERGQRIEWTKPYNANFEIVIEGEKLQLWITEGFERTEHKMTAEETARKKREYWWNPPRWDYRANGKLKLSLHSVEFSEIHSSWSDGKRQTIEHCLGEIVVACLKAGPAVKQARKARFDAEQQRIRQQKREQCAAHLRAEYERKTEVVKQLSQAWRESNQFRDFAAALQAKALAPSLSEETRQELEAMIDWTVRHSFRLNPLSRLNRTLQQFKNSSYY